MRDRHGRTALAAAIKYNKVDCAELLLDAGAKVSSLRENFKVPDWMNAIVTKRQNAKHALQAFIRVLRTRLLIPGPATQHIGNRLPRDLVNLLTLFVWNTRLDSGWGSAR